MMKMIKFPVIDMVATGKNIQRLREERNLTVHEVQEFFGFEEPAAIYRWQRGDNLPTVDNLCALSKLFEVPMEDILVLKESNDPDGKRRMVATRKNKQTKKILFFLAA